MGSFALVSSRSFRPGRKFLLFSSVDTGRSAHDFWLSGSDRNYDVVLYIYSGDLPDKKVDLCVKRKGFKFPNFYEFCKTTDVSNYDAVWIVDDDIQMCTDDINKMFELFYAYDLWLGQPAFDSSSVTGWEMAIVDEAYRLRYANFVENGVALFSREAIKVCLSIMKHIRSGFGSDFLFSSLIGSSDNRIAILDEVQCHHPPVNSTLDELIPRSLHYKDAEDLMKKYDYGYFTPRIIGGIRLQG